MLEVQLLPSGKLLSDDRWIYQYLIHVFKFKMQLFKPNQVVHCDIKFYVQAKYFNKIKYIHQNALKFLLYPSNSIVH